jgi:hypothetical protein
MCVLNENGQYGNKCWEVGRQSKFSAAMTPQEVQIIASLTSVGVVTVFTKLLVADL